jgi:predicted nucleic acid-binding protein
LILYLDTSVVVAVFTHEAETARMQRWLGDQDPELLAISDWVTAEFSSALSIKLRSGQIETQHRADALAMFTTMSAETFTVLPVSGAQFHTAARFADQHALGLRAGDALHLAICADHGATLCTLDRRLGEVGPALAVKTALL